MIQDLSQTLRALLDQPGLPEPLASAEIAFDRPIEQFNPQTTTIDLFLYDIRENVELRNSESDLDIDFSRGLATLRRPPLRIDCTYLITAWPIGGMDVALQEHQLLSQVLQVFARYPTIPEPFLQGSLRDQDLPLPLAISAADGLKNPAEFWTALSSPLRASIAIRVTLSLSAAEAETLPIAIAHKLSLNGDIGYQIGGRVTDAGDRPIAAATVVLVERNLSATTDAEGCYSFGAVPASTYTLRVRRPNIADRDFPMTVPPLTARQYNVRV
jgi:Pvc16 N-terminal domain/Carboxypeptidase regulatory-like domain